MGNKKIIEKKIARKPFWSFDVFNMMIFHWQHHFTTCSKTNKNNNNIIDRVNV